MTALPDALDVVLQFLAHERENCRRIGASRTLLDGLLATPDAALADNLVEEVPTAARPLRPAPPAASDPKPEPAPIVAEFRFSGAATGSKAERLARLRSVAEVCQKCPHLAASRRTVVFGVGNPEAELIFVGEAPGADEDVQGEPFVGRAGQLLTKIIETMGYRREDVYIANILKCRPDTPGQSAGNRPPTPEEMTTCLPYLLEQIEVIQPKVIVALGPRQ